MHSLFFRAKKRNPAAKDPLFSRRLLYSFGLLTLLMVARAFSDVFCFLFLGVAAFLFVIFSISECFSLLVFILPFSNILKLDADGMSIFTFLFFGLVLRMMLIDSRFDLASFFAFVVFGAYALAVSGLDQLTTVITLMAGLLLVKKVDGYHVNAEPVVVSFSIGLCVSSLVALFRDKLPLINRFLSNATLKLEEGVFASRFAGLEGNPNYFTVDVIFAIACLAVILLNGKQRRLHFLLIGALTLFGLMSVSKSFLISYALLLVFWFINTARQGGAANAMKFVLLGAILIGLVFVFARESVDLFLFRFSVDESSTLNTISTGRFGIWQTYLNEILHDFRILIFGKGLNTVSEIGRGSHNSYFEALYTLGLIGIAWFLFAIKKAFEGIHWDLVLFMPLAMLLFRMFAISLVTYDNLWIYFVMLKLLAHSIAKEEYVLTGGGEIQTHPAEFKLLQDQ